MSTFVIVPGAWDTPATWSRSSSRWSRPATTVIVVDLPCEDADATLERVRGRRARRASR